MAEDILELYPDSGRRHPLHGLYLEQTLAHADDAGRPYIYTNFIASLDGRIALPGAGRHSHQVPPAIANARDWRLFQELAAQADLLITSARYFRQAAGREAQAELPLGSAREFDDLRDWRIAQGLSAQPDIAIFSASLDIPQSALDHYRERKLFLVTGAAADPVKLARLSADSDLQVITCGTQATVDATQLRAQIAGHGYRRVYAIAGPSVLHTLAAGGALDRLYHTTAHCLLGGTEFDTFVWGDELQPAVNLPLQAMYLDTLAPAGCGQTLAVYGC